MAEPSKKTSGMAEIIGIGGRYVEDVEKVAEVVRQKYSALEETSLSDMLDALSVGTLLTQLVCVQLSIDDPLTDPRRPCDAQLRLFERFMGMIQKTSVVVVIPVSYRGFWIGGVEPYKLRHRLHRLFYSCSKGVEVSRSPGGSVVVIVEDYLTGRKEKWVL